MITSDTIKIKKNEKISTEYIENEMKNLGIEPLRWAIVGVEDKELIISIAYTK